ncbi:MAG TPA: ethanolamine ammonia-lyase subunit EutC [Bryobacteraceae bacterium]
MKRLRDYTNARVGLGSVGHSLPTAALLDLNLDHARARDAVHRELGALPIAGAIEVHSAARDRAEYLRRPDLGRRLNEASQGKLIHGEYDAAIVIADGLSALAVERYAERTLTALEPYLREWSLAPIVIARQARVALGDEIGFRLGARMMVILIGERPGLSSPDSLGAYLTYDPRESRTDAERNCISNIRDEGLKPEQAAYKLWFLMSEARTRKLSGIVLKEDAPAGLIGDWGTRSGSKRE